MRFHPLTRIGTVMPGSFNRRLFIKGAALSLVGLTVFGFDSVAFAAKASDETLAALDAAQAEYEAALAELQSIGSQLEDAEYRLSECRANLDSTNEQIAELEASITQKQDELILAQDVLADRVSANYRAGKADLLGVLLEASSFEDFVSRLYYAEKVSDSDTAAIQDVKTIKEELELQEQRLQEQRVQQEQLLSEQQAYADELAATVAYYQEYTASLSSNVTSLMNQAQQELLAAQQAEYEAYLAQQAQQQGSQSAGTDGLGTNESAGTGESDAGTSDSGGEQSDNVQPEPPAYEPDPVPQPDPEPGYSGGNHVYSVADIAWNYIGVPYVWGGTDPSGFDCSGLAQYCYAQAGYSISRTTYTQADEIAACGQMTYNMSDLQPGDLVFPHSGHVGIYMGDGMMIHAPYPGTYVQYAPVYAFSFGGCPV